MEDSWLTNTHYTPHPDTRAQELEVIVTADLVSCTLAIPLIEVTIPERRNDNPRQETYFCWSVGFWMIVFSPSITCCFSWCDSIPAKIRESISTLRAAKSDLHY